MKLDAFDLKQRLSRQIALPTLRATHDGDVFDHQKAIAASVASCHSSGTSTLLAADITNHIRPHSSVQEESDDYELSRDTQLRHNHEVALRQRRAFQRPSTRPYLGPFVAWYRGSESRQWATAPRHLEIGM